MEKFYSALREKLNAKQILDVRFQENRGERVEVDLSNIDSNLSECVQDAREVSIDKLVKRS